MAWTFITLLALVFVFVAWLLKPKASTKKLPPGPRGLPVFGSLHLLGELPHQDLHRLAQKYGPIMHLRLGRVNTIVVSSPRAAELFLKAHDLVFASRPLLEAAKYLSYDQKNLSFAPYGSYWRNMRKMCTLELLSNPKINSFRWMRKEELNVFIESIKEASQHGGVVNLSEKVTTLIAGMACRMIFGKKYEVNDIDEKGFKDLIQEGMHLFAKPNIGDYIPQISRFDMQGITKKMEIVAKKFDDFLEMIVDEHVEMRRSSTGNKQNTQDFVDVMLDIMGSREAEYILERDNVKAIILDMFVAASDTSASIIEWALSELIRHPTVMKKVQKELEDVVGLERMVEESDLEKLNYLEMVVKETFRLHPAGPLLLPHASIEDCTIDGFHIPKKSHLMVNTWAIGRDPMVWPEAEKFWPERFEGSKVDLRGKDFELLPFGYGRRSCPGMQLGLIVVPLVLGQLVHCFDWELPNGMLVSELDMMEKFGLVTSRAKHLLAMPSYRLNL